MRTISATVGAEIELRGLDPSTISRLRRTLRYPNPEYLKAKMQGATSDDVASHLHACEERDDGAVVVPRGAVPDLKMVLALKRIKVSWDDRRTMGEPLCAQLTLPDGGALRDYQHEGVELTKRFLQGLIVLPCGGGKTFLGMGAIQRIGRSALVVVPTRDLVDQWAADAELVLGVTPAIFGSGKHSLGPLTIATKDALCHHRDLSLAAFGTVVFDEAHRVPSRTHRELLSRLPARYRLGLTATPTRADGGTKLIEYSFGDTLLERSVQQLVDKGWLVLPSVETVFTSFRYSLPEEPSWPQLNRMTDAMMRDTARNQMIVSLITAEPHETWAILSPSRKEHCYALAEKLQLGGVKAVAVTSDMSKGKRRATIDALRDGAIQVMCATSLADEGLNIKRLSRIVLALPESSRRNTAQRVGRCMRPLGHKRPKVFDIVDIDVERLRKRWTNRKSEYRKLGLEIIECPTLNLFPTATP